MRNLPCPGTGHKGSPHDSSYHGMVHGPRDRRKQGTFWGEREVNMSSPDKQSDVPDNGSADGEDGGGGIADIAGNAQDGGSHSPFLTQNITVSKESFMDWINNHGTDILVAAAIGTVLFFVMLYGRRTARKLLEKVDPTLDAGASKVLARVITQTNRWFIAFASARIVISSTSPPDAIFNLISTGFLITSAFQGAIWARELILAVIEARRETVNPDDAQSIKSAMTVIRLLVNVVVFTIAIILILDNLGVNVTGLMAGLGIGGIAIGLAAQGIFSDLFAALSILFDEPFKRGDTISYDNTKGTVKQIGLKTTRLRSENGEEKIISNAKLLDKEISNKSDREFRRELMILSIVYQTSPELAERIPHMLKEIVENCKGTFSHAGFTDFRPSSIDYELEFFSASDGEEGFQIRHKVGIEIIKRFAKEGIKFAYPTQTNFIAAPDGQLVMPNAKSSPPTKPARTRK